MAPEPCKTAGNLARSLSKPTGVREPNAADTTMTDTHTIQTEDARTVAETLDTLAAIQGRDAVEQVEVMFTERGRGDKSFAADNLHEVKGYVDSMVANRPPSAFSDLVVIVEVTA